MAYNKIMYGENTLIDLTSDTVAANNLLNGVIAHDKTGTVIEGEVIIQNYYTGSSAPSPSLGQNGDIYLET